MPPPVSLGVIVICAAIFLARNLSPELALWPLDSGFFGPWQLVSYGFLHGGFNHLFFNMFAVWMFGSVLENVWGPKRFLIYYFVTGIGAAIIHSLVLWYNIAPVKNALSLYYNDPSLEAFRILIPKHFNPLWFNEFISNWQMVTKSTWSLPKSNSLS